MTLSTQYPVGSTVLVTSFNAVGEVISINSDTVVINGIGKFFGNCYAVDSSEVERLSDGHFGLTNKYEYFTHGKDLYRAPFVNPVGLNGLRQGARSQMAIHLLDSEYLQMLGL